MMIFGLWKIKSRSVSYKGIENKAIEDKAIRFAKKYVCGNCCMQCKQIDLLCGCGRYYMNAFKDGYKTGYSDGYEVGKKNERELQCGKNHLENLTKENEVLKQQIERLKC